jgi:hypothetical protein
LDYRGRRCAGRHRNTFGSKGHAPERFRRLTGLPESGDLLPRQAREAFAAALTVRNEARSGVCPGSRMPAPPEPYGSPPRRTAHAEAAKTLICGILPI